MPQTAGTAATARDPAILISGFTVIRNAMVMGYPVVEAIRSILPICDEYIVAVGAGDGTKMSRFHYRYFGAQEEQTDDPTFQFRQMSGHSTPALIT